MHELPCKDNNKLIKIEELIIEIISGSNYKTEIERLRRIRSIEGIHPITLILSIRQVMEKKKKRHLVPLLQSHQLPHLKIIRDSSAYHKGSLILNLHKITINKIIHLEYFPKGP